MQFKLYRCARCGNIIVKVKDSGVLVVCCGEPMQELKANTTEAATEKHIPVLSISEDKVDVTIGEILHPMTNEHFIEFVLLVTNLGYKINHLKPNNEPKTTFALERGEKVLNCYAYCNLHSLWVK